jgi:hypothetical protein
VLTEQMSAGSSLPANSKASTGDQDLVAPVEAISRAGRRAASLITFSYSQLL